MNCNCNQGRLPCTCCEYRTPHRPRGVTPIFAAVTLTIVLLYLGAHWLIGG